MITNSEHLNRALAWRLVFERLRRLAEMTKDHHVTLTLDAEDCQQLTDMCEWVANEFK